MSSHERGLMRVWLAYARGVAGLAHIASALPPAGLGPVTTTGEVFAGSIGAGVLLGGFLAGVVGLLCQWDRRRRDDVVFAAGAFGGVAMVMAAAIEAAAR